VFITGLSTLGKEQRFIVIPNEIRGMPVESIRGRGYLIGGIGPANFKSDNLEKLFILASVGGNIELKNEAKVFNINLSTASVLTEFNEWNGWNGGGIVVDYESINNRYIYNDIYNLLIQLTDKSTGHFALANTTYYLNYETNVNHGVYWLDDIEYDERTEFIPPNPTRKGYKFAGWFTEPEATNQWCFETHKKSNERLNLYAKWI
jgi:uncharacterized repeat protein (TIGR02543 family)